MRIQLYFKERNYYGKEMMAELGIDVIWLAPVYQSPNDDNGYDIRDYQAIMPEFGTMEEFKNSKITG